MKKKIPNIKLKQIVRSDEKEYIYKEYYEDSDGDVDDLIFECLYEDKPYSEK